VSSQLLLADSSVTIQRVIRLTFADEDVNVTTVGDGSDAVAAIDQSPPDIVLADIDLPNRSGYDIARHLRDTARLAHIPVVLLAGAFDVVDDTLAAAVGCDRVLSKPFDPQLVIECVRDLLATPKRVPAPAAASLQVGDEADTPAKFAAGIDDYFDRLDLQLSNGGDSSGAALADPAQAFAIEIDGFEPAAFAPGELSSGFEPPASAAHPAAFGRPLETADRHSSGSAWDDAAPAARTLPEAVELSAASRAVPAGLVDEIASRVIERLMIRLSADSVPNVVTAVAERLVRAEIEIIKSRL
jgi:CheY-like chemotaxis protein